MRALRRGESDATGLRAAPQGGGGARGDRESMHGDERGTRGTRESMHPEERGTRGARESMYPEERGTRGARESMYPEEPLARGVRESIQGDEPFARGLRGASQEDEVLARGLLKIAARVQLLASATPRNLGVEVARVVAAWAAGHHEAPRFVYAPPPDLSAERAALARARDAFRGRFASIYAGRAAELEVEAAACEAAGTPDFRRLARARYARRDTFDDEADGLAQRWATIALGPATGETITSDDAMDGRSLLSLMRRAVGEQRLPFRVVVARDLAPLAATGDGVILVAAGRRLTAEIAARTVMHEVLGHALPAARAAQASLALFEVGSRFGSDDQEGRAVLLEERASLLGSARRRELGLRHLAARSVEASAHFVETTRQLLERGARAEEAVRIAARVHRGGGLAREIAYVPAFLRVRAAFAEASDLEDVLANGRVAIDAARTFLAA